MRALLPIATALAVAASLAACGAPDRLDSKDDHALAAARSRIDDSLDSEEAIRTSHRLASSLSRRVELAANRNDARAVARMVPSLVQGGQVDAHAAAAFTSYATSDPARALLIPAQGAVDDLVSVVDDSGADGDTKVPSARDQKMDAYLTEVRRDLAGIWPALAQQVADAL